MAQRITWQNVAAPDFGAAVAAQRNAGDLISRAAGQIGDSLGALDYRNREKASQSAMAEALKYQDPDAWEKMLAGPGLGALGVDPSRATGEFMDFAKGYQSTLTNREQAAYETDRGKLADTRFDTEYARKQANDAANIEAMGIANEIARGSNSREEADRSLLNRKLTPQMEQMVLGHLGNQAGSRWQALPDATSQAGGLDSVQVINETLQSRDRELQHKYGANDSLRLWREGTERYSGASSPVNGLIASVRGFGDPSAGAEEGSETFTKSVGEVQSLYNSYAKKYNLAPEIIATVMENNLKETGVGGLFDSKRTFDKRTIEQTLERLNDPEERAALEQSRAGYERETAALAGYQARLGTLQRNYALAASRGASPEQLQQIAQQIDLLQTELSPAAAPGSANVITPAPPAPQATPNQTVPPQSAPTQAPPVSSQPAGSIDPRIENSRAALSRAAGSASSVAGNVGQGVDNVVSDGVSLLNRGLTGAARGATLALGQVAPETASGILQGLDRFSAGTDALAREGVVPGVTPGQLDGTPLPSEVRTANAQPEPLREQPPAPAEASPAVSEAARNPQDALEIIAAEADVSPQLAQEAQKALRALQSKLDPDTGEPLSRAQQKQLLRSINRMIAVAQENVGISDATGASGADPNNPLVQLLNQPEAWLRY